MRLRWTKRARCLQRVSKAVHVAYTPR
jgi:hypothetical protein